MTGDIFTTWSKPLAKISLLSTLPQKMGDKSAIFLYNYISKGQFPGL